jgi:hypothetical protein
VKEQLPRLLESVAVDALPAKPGTSVDLFPPPFGSARAETEPNKGQRFVDDKVRCDQRLTRLECGIASLTTQTMGRVCGVCAGDPACGIDEQSLHDP